MLLAVFLGGAIGGLARWGLADGLGAGAQAGAWPTGTLVANLVGAFLLGVVAAHLRDRREAVHALLGPGLCGALTTFSTLQVEVVRLVDDGYAGTAFVYLAVSVAAGFTLVQAGLRT